MRHKHRCPQCGVIWEHSLFDKNRSQLCPVCGLFEARIYEGPDPATPADKITAMAAARGQERQARQTSQRPYERKISLAWETEDGQSLAAERGGINDGEN